MAWRGVEWRMVMGFHEVMFGPVCYLSSFSLWKAGEALVLVGNNLLFLDI